MTKVRTQLDKERQFKKQQGEGQELLDEMTQSDEEKAAKIIIEKNQEAEKIGKEEEEIKKDDLEKTRNKWSKKEYIWKLGTDMNEMAKLMDLPKGWVYRINCGKEKLNIIVTAPDGRRFGRGIIPTGTVTYDFHAVGVLVMQCENTVDKILKRGMFREDNIILPKGVK